MEYMTPAVAPTPRVKAGLAQSPNASSLWSSIEIPTSVTSKYYTCTTMIFLGFHIMYFIDEEIFFCAT